MKYAVNVLCFIMGVAATSLYFDHKLSELDRTIGTANEKVISTYQDTLKLADQTTEIWKQKAEQCTGEQYSANNIATVLWDTAPTPDAGNGPHISFFHGALNLSLAQIAPGRTVMPRWIVPGKIIPTAVIPGNRCQYFDLTTNRELPDLCVVVAVGAQ